MTGLYRLGIKLFTTDPGAFRGREAVPIFHSWIQKQCVKGHLLIDVHDYSHIQSGPGILLVAQEGNFSTDAADGRSGLVYFRKQPSNGNLTDALAATLRSVLEAAALLEAEPALEGRVRFLKDELLVISNDRLLAPNDAETFAEVKPALATVFGETATLSHASTNPKDRLTVRVHGAIRQPR